MARTPTAVKRPIEAYRLSPVLDAAAAALYLGAMAQTWLIPLAVVLATVAAMECVAAGVHRFIMHGPGWAWHRSHHEKREGLFERNDLYAVFFALLSILLFVAGSKVPLLWWVGLGLVVYGLGYALLHDGLVHRRVPFMRPPRNGYLKRLVQAHRLHHAVHEREGAVSFGFLYAPPVEQIRTRLRSNLSER